jgi:hypothetical protein
MASTEMRHARLLQPFPTKRLADAIYQVTATATGIDQRVTRLLINPHVTVQAWCDELDAVRDELETLAEHCSMAFAKVGVIFDSADADWSRAIDAATAMLRGLAEEQPPPDEGAAPTELAA